MHNSFSLGKIKNIEIKLHYSWFLILFLVVWSLAEFYFPVNYPGWTQFFYWAASSVAAILLFVSVLFHELSHSLVGKKRNIIVKSITLFVFGGVAEMVTEPQKPADEFKMAVAGPLASLFLGGCFFVVSMLEIGTMAGAIAHYLFLINSILAMFNLVPAFPLDGGRIFRSALWAASNDIDKATKRAVIVSRIFSFALMIWGFKLLLENNFLGGLWIIIISMFLLQAASSSLRQQRMEHVLSRIEVRNVMDKNFRSVSPKILLKDLAKDFIDYKQGGFPVEENEKLLGIVTIEDLRNVPRKQWATTRVEKVMTPREKLEVLRPTDTIYDGFLKLTNNDFGRLPVVEDGRVVGLVTRNLIILLLAVKCDKCV